MEKYMFIELTDLENNKFLCQKSDLELVFQGGLDGAEEDWVGEPAVVVVVSGSPTKIKETYEEIRKVLI